MHHAAQIPVVNHLFGLFQDFFRFDVRNVVQRRDGLGDDLGLAIPLDIPQLINFPAHYQAEGDPFPAGPPSTADTVHIIFVVLGDVEIKHRFHVFHVNPPGRHIRCHQNLRAAITEAVHYPVPLHLL